MIQSRLEVLLVSDDAFGSVAVRLIAVALAVHNAPAAHQQRHVKNRVNLHRRFKTYYLKSFLS